MDDGTIHLKDAPPVQGLTFRHFRGEEDYAAMLEVHTGSNLADGQDHALKTPASFRQLYGPSRNHDPYKDLILAQVDGKVVAFIRLMSRREIDGTYVYFYSGFVLPESRGEGIGRAMLRLIEARARTIQAGREEEASAIASMDAPNHKKDFQSLLEAEGYEPVRFDFNMETSDLDHIPDAQMPEGLEIRPAQPEQYLKIIRASVDAFRDEWGAVEMTDADIERWLNHPSQQPALWVVAWEDDQVVGSILNYIDHEYNERTGRKLGYTEYISVCRPWRRRGLARAMLARSMRVLKAQGMTQTALGVDTENLSGALRLYESMGYKVVSGGTTYRKRL